MSRRSRAREIVLQVLYEDDLNPERNPAVADEFLRNRLHRDAELVAFASELLAGVRRNRFAIDQLLKARAENWSLGRMAVIDRNILRLGAYELLHTETPHPVVINEAVELAKRFGAKQSPTFVNGLLDRVLRDRETPAEENQPASSEARPVAASAPQAAPAAGGPVRRGGGPLAAVRRENRRGGND